MRRLLRSTVPARLRRTLYKKLVREIGRLKAPKMVVGYRDTSGVWRERTRISDTVFLHRRENIRVADNIFIGHYTILDGTGGLEIGEGSQISAWVGFFTHSSHIAIRVYGNHYGEVPESEKEAFIVAPVRIGKYVFVGAGAKILPGVTIGDGALIAAGAIVTRDVSAFDIVSGNPAEVVGDTRKLDERYLEDQQLRKWYGEWQEN